MKDETTQQDFRFPVSLLISILMIQISFSSVYASDPTKGFGYVAAFFLLFFLVLLLILKRAIQEKTKKTISFFHPRFWILWAGILFALFVITVKLIQYTNTDYSYMNPGIAISSLRTLATSQRMFKDEVEKDQDEDGIGEYGYYVELTGLVPVPVGTKQNPPVSPAFTSTIFGKTSLNNSGIAQKNGYYSVIYLPSVLEDATIEAGSPILPVKKIPPSEKEQLEINLQETFWCAFAWPIQAGKTGNKVYFINQTGELFSTNNIESYFENNIKYFYSGKTRIPHPTDIYKKEEGLGIMEGTLKIKTPTAGKLIWDLD